MYRNKFIYWLSAIFILGFILRLLGIGYGLPYLTHPDEARVILDTLSMGHRASLIPERPDYALLYRYFLLLVFGVYYLIARSLQIFTSPLDFALKFFINPAPIYLISRFISVIFGTVIAIPAYIIGKKIFRSQAIGAVSSLFILFEFQLLQHSQWAIYPIVLSFFTLPAFYFMFCLIDNQRRRNFILSGLFTGLAISIQNQGIFLIPSLFLSYVFAYGRYRKEIKARGFLKFMGLSLLCLIIFSLLGNFYWFFIFPKAWIKTVELWGVTKVGFSSMPAYNYNIFSMLFWFMRELIRQDLFLGIMLVLGFFYSLFKHKPYDFVFILFIVTYLYFTSNWGFRILHDLLSLLPIMCIFAGRFLFEVSKGLFKNKHLYFISVLVILPLIYQSLIVDIKKLHKDTRLIAREWIENNIPAGYKIGVDFSMFSVPLESQTPFLLRNPIAKKYYESNLEPFLAKEYRAYLNSKHTYQIEELMQWADAPIWPKDMLETVIKEANKHIVYRDLYSRFMFKDIAALINEGKLDYIIITSYTWGMFLFDNNPYKQNLHNPFIKDRQELNYRHASNYIDDKRHGYIFYLVKQGRSFYESLLYNKIANIELIKELYPDANNLGPTIRIYKIIRHG